MRMFRAIVPALVLATYSVGAQSQDSLNAPAIASEPSVDRATVPPASQSEDAPAGGDTAPAAPLPLWTATLSTGIGARDNAPDGTWQALTLQRQIGRGYLRASAMRYHGTLVQADAALPSDYLIATLGTGANIGNWVFDAWASYGIQDYGQISTESGSRASTGATSSRYYSAGADFGRILTVAPHWYLTPTVTAAYAHGQLLRPAPEGSGLTDLETSEPTWSATATLRLDHAFGASRQNYLGLVASRNWSSNGISELFFSLPDEDDGRPPTHLDSRHHPDSWFEAGATANLKVTQNLYLDLFATRSFGVASGNTTSAGLSLRRKF